MTNKEQNSYFPLPKTLKKYGYTYTLYKRGQKALIYEITSSKSVIGYEVFKIVITRRKEINGKMIPSHEKFPRENDFGSTAWDFVVRNRALEKFNQLEIEK